MPQPITHNLVIKQAMRNKVKDLWKNYGNYSTVGSFGPDLFYMKDLTYFEILGYSYAFVADVMHWEGSLDFYCCMLDYMKRNFIKNKVVFDKLKAFAYGYYSHVITDVVFHPYVYRKSNDHWLYHDNNDYLIEHKTMEKIIDCYLLKSFEGLNPYTFGYQNYIQIYEQNNQKTLDNDVFYLLLECMNSVYPKLMDKQLYNPVRIHSKKYADYFVGFSVLDDEHPIHESYDDFVDTMEELYTIVLLSNIPMAKLQALVPLKNINKELIDKYINNNKDYYIDSDPYKINNSVMELFDKAVDIMEKIIEASENFINSSEFESKNYFNEFSGIAYLTKNYNLDTGLPTELNDTPDNLAHDNQRFNVGLQFLS